MTMPIVNPLELPEIRARISLFVTVQDAIACAQVCKDWSCDFTRVVWHTLDFDAHVGLQSLDTTAFQKYGDSIRVIRNLRKGTHIALLLRCPALRVKNICVFLVPYFQPHLFNLIYKSNASLEHIHIVGSTVSKVFLPIDTMVPDGSSRLSHISFGSLIMLRSAFSSLLKLCPLLERLHIRYTTLTHDAFDAYPHPRLNSIVAPVGQVFQPDPYHPYHPGSSSLLVHFPNLTSWQIWGSNSSTLEFTADIIKKEVAQCCPLVRSICAEVPEPIAVELLEHVFTGLTEVFIDYDQMHSDSVVMAALTHQKTLNSFGAFVPFGGFYECEKLFTNEDHLQESASSFQMLPRLCPRLKLLRVPQVMMDIEVIEKEEWNCKGLEELAVRIRGLDTKEKIARTMKLWVDARTQMKATESATINRLRQDDSSIEGRVARHLLNFPRLREVWLGAGVHKITVIAPSSLLGTA